MTQQLAHGLDIFVRSFLQQAALEWPVQLEHRPVGDRFVADQHISFENLLRHHVGRPSDEAVDDEALAVRRGDRAARCAEVDADVEDFSHSLPFYSPQRSQRTQRHLCDLCGESYVPFFAYSEIPRKSACAICCRYCGLFSITASRSFDRHPTSANTAGMSVATRTMNGARLMPQFSSPGSMVCKFAKSCCCTADASRCDSSRRTSA